MWYAQANGLDAQRIYSVLAMLRRRGLLPKSERKRRSSFDVERFMRTIKQEEVYLSNYETYLDVIENLPMFIA